MKVRRKSEIAEAVQDEFGNWKITRLNGDVITCINEHFAAHYEPVPEPPARECSFCGKPKDDELHEADAHRLKHSSLAADDFHDFASVSGEQPAIFGTSQPEMPIRTASGNIDELLRKVAPHRATIALIPHLKFYRIEVDGVMVRNGAGWIWMGTEAEAKAKMESLGK